MPEIKTPKVTLLTHTALPLETVYSVWAASKGEDALLTPEQVRDNVDPVEVRKLFRAVIAQKIPVGEHVDFVFMFENISVSWREQAVRHRIGTKPSPERVGADIVMADLPDLADSSFWSQSMRIQDMGSFADNMAYRVPESILQHEQADRLLTAYHHTMNMVQTTYKQLVALGIPMEDARELIPLGAQHRMSWKLNIGSLQHIVGKRGCVTGDTRIPLLDGRTRTMKQLLDEYGTQRDFWVYSCDKDGRVVPGKARHNGVTQQHAELVEVVLDNGESIRATPDHRFMLRDGGYRRADELLAGQSLMPLYRDVSDGLASRPQDRIVGYERVYMPGGDCWEFTHRAVAGAPPGDGRTVIHHDDFDKRNNTPGNLAWMDCQDHIRLHSRLTAGLSSAEQSRRAKMASGEVRAKAGKAAAAKGVLVANGAKAAEANRGNKERAERISASLKKHLASPEARAQRSEATKAQWANPEVRENMARRISQAMRGRSDTAPCRGDVAASGLNHKVVEVRRLVVREDVYDLSVDDHHNYATGAGVFIHNCWILQLGIWGPIIEGMINELSTKVDPIFSELVTPPCLKEDSFTGCIYHEENRRRYSGEDKGHAPCPLHFKHHQLPENMAKSEDIAAADTPEVQERFKVPYAEQMRQRAEAYQDFWGRDPYSGKRLRVIA